MAMGMVMVMAMVIFCEYGLVDGGDGDVGRDGAGDEDCDKCGSNSDGGGVLLYVG